MSRLDQKGISLPLVLGIMGLIIANTYYFMDLGKSTKQLNVKRGAEIDDNSEKVRLATFLTDKNVCTSNFGSKTISTINQTVPAQAALTKGGVNFLQLNGLYSRESLKLDSYSIIQTSTSAPIEKRYSFIATYKILNRDNAHTETTKRKVIRLPLYIIFSGGSPTNAITNCYSEADKDLNTVSAAVTAACNGNTALLVNSGLYECQHNINEQTCNGAVNGVSVTSSTQNFSCAAPANIAGNGTAVCPTTPIRQLMYEVTTTDLVKCDSTDNSCAPGDMLIMDAGNTPRCLKPCPSTQLLQMVASTGVPTCWERPALCAKGEYASEVKQDGSAVCEPYKIINKQCAALKLATDINPLGANNADAALGCTTYTKVKACPSPNKYKFVQSFATGNTPNCTTFAN